MSLCDAVLHHARQRAHACAVAGLDGELSYGELDRLAAVFAGSLGRRGVSKGDRVALHLPKSARAVAAMQAVMRCGAVYVPVDPLLPESRVAAILRDCSPRLVVTEPLLDELANGEPQEEIVESGPDDAAYILYTSGSTGDPKGICLSHGNAEAFVSWVVETIHAHPEDRFANHAPFSFDLSVLDLYAAFQAGASVHLIPETASFDAPAMNRFLRQQRITVWYSVPSVLQMMLADAQFPAEAETALRVLFFAGESFPIRPLRQLRQRWRQAEFWNLYGPTETNVCTAYRVDAIAADREIPVPIGRACSGDRVWAEKADGSIAAPGEEGELIVEGPTVMLGYWGREPQQGPYRTGDWVRMLKDGDFELLGRIDSMVKLRGYRVELGAVEAALMADPRIVQAAVVVEGAGLDAKLVAYIVGKDCPGLLEIKRICAQRLPRYMIVDRVRRIDALPLNRNGKVDRKKLTEEFATETVHG